jgi:hypothetical protein
VSAIAGQLNARKVTMANGGRWTHVQVGQILDRAAGGMTQRIQFVGLTKATGSDGRAYAKTSRA